MSIIVYKQRHFSINHANTPKSAREYLKYISERKGAVKKNNMGLFGVTNGFFEETVNLKDAMSTVYEAAARKRKIYQGYICFKKNDAKIINLKNREDWEKYIRKHMPVIAKKNKIKIEHLKYYAAYHKKGNKPHVHIVFWDDSIEVESQWTPP